jgi:hypothetical protein
LAPWVPVYWVVGVLEKVRAFFVNEPVRLGFMFWLHKKVNSMLAVFSLCLLLNVRF